MKKPIVRKDIKTYIKLIIFIIFFTYVFPLFISMQLNEVSLIKY